MSEKKDITAAFTGHRTYEGEADAALRDVVQELYGRGYRRFLVGMAWGFDLAAGRAVMALKEQVADVELVAVVPYEEFRQRFSDEDKVAYDEVEAAASELFVVSQMRGSAAYRKRNDYLVDNASVVVAWWNGHRKGGTAYTVRRAVKRGCEVINLLLPEQMELFE